MRIKQPYPRVHQIGGISRREERHLQKLERTIGKRDLIIVDELGYVPLGQ